MMENTLCKLYQFLELIDCSEVTAIVNFAKHFINNEEREVIRILCLFVISLFTEEIMRNDFQLLNLNKNDVSLVISGSLKLPFSKLQSLKFFISMSFIESNLSLISAENVLQFITSVYGSDDMIAEQELSSVILSRVFAGSTDLRVPSSDEKNCNEIVPNIEKLISTVVDEIALHAQEAKDTFTSDEDRGLRICLILQEILAALSSENSLSVLNTIAMVPFAVNVFCLFMKLHLDHRGKLLYEVVLY